jgi:hypothetical protein
MIALEPRVVGGERVWVIRTLHMPLPKWFGCLRRYAQGKPHSMDAIRKSIAKAKRSEHAF